jgi:hypothetical protein
MKKLHHIYSIFTINIDNMENRVYELHHTLLDANFVSYPVNKIKLILMEINQG